MKHEGLHAAGLFVNIWRNHCLVSINLAVYQFGAYQLEIHYHSFNLAVYQFWVFSVNSITNKNYETWLRRVKLSIEPFLTQKTKNNPSVL